MQPDYPENEIMRRATPSARRQTDTEGRTMTRKEQALRLKLLDTLRERFKINDREIFISASVGITYFPDDATSIEDLLKNADAAMYRAKHNKSAAS